MARKAMGMVLQKAVLSSSLNKLSEYLFPSSVQMMGYGIMHQQSLKGFIGVSKWVLVSWCVCKRLHEEN